MTLVPNVVAKRLSRLKPGARAREAALRALPRNRKKEYATMNARRHDLKTWPIQALHRIVWRAKRQGLVCTISTGDIQVPEFCPVLGIRLSAGNGTPMGCSPS